MSRRRQVGGKVLVLVGVIVAIASIVAGAMTYITERDLYASGTTADQQLAAAAWAIVMQAAQNIGIGAIVIGVGLILQGSPNDDADRAV